MLNLKCYSTLSKFLIIFILLLSSCDKEDDWQYENYKIPKDAHSSTYRYENLLNDNIRFKCIFDNSAIYTSIDPVNQWDVNKLMGFADCDHHQTNSARFGWRWLNGGLQIVTYVYNNGNRLPEKLIKVVSLDTPHEYQLTMTSDSYIFRIDDVEVTETRYRNCSFGHYYMLYPYFGGDESAPHDIHIKIKDLKFVN